MKSVVCDLLFGGAVAVLVANSANGGQDEVRTPAFSVTINATDARTKQPLKSIRVVPTSYNARAKQVTWQSQYLKRYESLPATFEMDRGWPETQLRIEADGYLPVVTKPLARKTKIVLDVALEPDVGIVGRVLTPDGVSASGATVAVCTWTNEVTVRDGRLKYGHHAERLSGLVQAAEDGSFRMPGEVDEWVLVIAHESGYAESTAAEFAEQSTVTLKPWGRLEGEFILGGKPMAGQTVNIGAGRGDVQVVLHYTVDSCRTDAAGHFVADGLPPVKLYVTPQFTYGDASFNLLWFSGLVEIKPNETTRITLPRAGQAVTGQLALPQDSGLSLEDVEIELSIALRPPSISGFRDQVSQNHTAYARFMESEQGKSFRREMIPVGADGRFRIEGLPETYYVLRTVAYLKPATSNAERGKAIASYSSRVQVPVETDAGETVDLETVTLTLHPATKN